MRSKHRNPFYTTFLWSALLLLIIGFGSCNYGFQGETDKLETYLKNVHAKDLEEALYIIVPVNSCDGCRQLVYRNLLTTSHSKEIRFIFSGRVQEAMTNQYLSRLSIMEIGMLFDPQELVKDYDLLGQEYPMSFISFFDVKAGAVVSKEILKPDMINGEIDIREKIFKNYIK